MAGYSENTSARIHAGERQIILKFKTLDLVQSEKDWRAPCAAEQSEKSEAAA